MHTPESRVRWLADALKGQIDLAREALSDRLDQSPHPSDADWLLQGIADGVDTLMEEVTLAFRWHDEDAEPGAH